MTPTATTATSIPDQQELNKIMELQVKLANDPALQAQVLDNPYQAMVNFGVPEKFVASFLLPTTETETASKSSSGDSDQGMTITSHWWGFEISLNEQLCSDLENGLFTVAGLSTIIAACAPPLSVIAGIIAGVLAVMGGVIGLADQGKGVHFDLNWIQLGAAIPTLGATLYAAMIPIPN